MSTTSTKSSDTTLKPLLKAKFTELVALNFQIDPRILEPHVPKGVELNFFKDETYVSLVAMMLKDIRVYGFPIHIAKGFEEMNLRFYVRRKVGDEYRNGACFLKDYLPSHVGRWFLGRIFNAEFGMLKMKHNNKGFEPNGTPDVDYQWKVGDHWNRIRVKAREQVKRTESDTKVGFILNHSNEYSFKNGQTLEYPVKHPKWKIWNAGQANFTCDVKRLFGPEFVKPLSRRPASVFVADGSEVVIYKPNVVV